MASGSIPQIKTQRLSSKWPLSLKNDAEADFSIVNPSTGEVLTSITEGTEADVEVAIQAADKAFNTVWGLNTPGFERGKLLIKIAELMERDLDILASIEALDNGKTFSVAKAFDVSGWSSCYDSRPCQKDSDSK
jgi:aldehyde dehydrogenase (NAD+)